MDEEKGNVYFDKEAYSKLHKYLSVNKTSISKVFILTDSNTIEHCLPLFLQNIGILNKYELVEIEPGEENKNIDTVTSLWNTLTELGADRKSLLINIGGGVLTDMGGFVASTFKRGIKFINVPTTLLSMVDASTGGKTGIDLGNLKNQIGVFNIPEMVLIHPKFLNTLDARQLRSGLAEMMKHGLIADKNHWKDLNNLHEFEIENLRKLIETSVNIKISIVDKDPKEQGLRKVLNFGHTIGHAIETFYMNTDKMLFHGEAIAIGMIAEAYLASIKTGLNKEDADTIKNIILEYFPKTTINKDDFPTILNLMKHDKKNENGAINFSLLKDIGSCTFDCMVSDKDIMNALLYYDK